MSEMENPLAVQQDGQACKQAVCLPNDEDKALIAKVKKSKQGAAFSRLWDGDISEFNGDAEQADIALCGMLAFWTQRDKERMDRLFRLSGLMRDAWDVVFAGSTYGQKTISDAISDCSCVYNPKEHFNRELDKITVTTPSGIMTLKDFHPEKNERYGWSDIGNGYLFADWYEGLARYVPERKKWFIYDGRMWRSDTGGLMAMELCKKLADALVLYALSLPDGDNRDAYRKFVEQWQKRSNRETILKDATGVHSAELSEFDANPMLFNCLNGTLNVQTLEFHKHTAKDMLSKIAGVYYRPSAKCERWERFIGEVMKNDADKALFLQKALGLALTGDTSHECFFILYGPKSRNGKGTCMETFMKLVGDYGKTTKPDTIAQRQTANGSGPSEDIARLAGTRFVNIAEPDKRLVLSAALVKTLTGNDTINARFLNENSFDYRPQFKLFINTNHLPAVTDVTLFNSGRVKVIPFERHFADSDRDTNLKGELSRPESLSGILNWCARGFQKIRETGFDEPESVLAATSQYKQDSDRISRFIADEMEKGQGFEVQTSAAYARYQQWCVTNGFREGSSKTFKADMENSVNIVRKRPCAGGENTTMILGYKLKEAEERPWSRAPL